MNRNRNQTEPKQGGVGVPCARGDLYVFVALGGFMQADSQVSTQAALRVDLTSSGSAHGEVY